MRTTPQGSALFLSGCLTPAALAEMGADEAAKVLPEAKRIAKEAKERAEKRKRRKRDV